MTVWKPKKSKEYKDAKINIDTPSDVANKIVDKEYNKPTWPLYLLALIFAVLGIIVFIITIENGEFILDIADIISFRGGFAGLFLICVIYCIYSAQPRVNTKK